MAFDNVDPNNQAESASSRTEIELRAVEARRLELLAKLDQENAVKAGITPAVRLLAIGLHSELCPHDHASLACTWFQDTRADDPQAADWTEVAHMRWLGIAAIGCQLQRAQGWTVEEPA